MAAITLTDITKQFDDVTAVDNIDLDIRSKEFLVLVGPSGCGKSTTLRMIAGLEDTTSGEFHIGDRKVNELEPKERNIAMVFQNYALYPHMTSAENMKFGMKSVTDYADDEIDRHVTEAADILDIPELLDRRPDELSGGERQRVAIGRAIVREPDVFLLDEPLSNLDAKLRVQMRAELLQIHGELDTTTLYVTHDQTEAMTLGDRVAVMNDGQIEQVAPPQHLYDFPSTSFVAEFVGNPAMNLVPVSVKADDSEYRAVHEGFSTQLPENPDVEKAVGRDALFGVRPEDVSLRRNLDNGTETFTAEVRVREPLGEALLMHVDVGSTDLQIKVEPRSEIRPGDEIEIGFDRDRLHLFEAPGGDALYHSTTPVKQDARTPVTED
jgi:multiple sugar transport system ATP-binding protein